MIFKSVALASALLFTADAFTISSAKTSKRLKIPWALAAAAPANNALEALSKLTVLSIDSGDLDVVAQYSDIVTDCTTNPLFVSQAGANGDARYQAMMADAISYAKATLGGGDASLPDPSAEINLAMDKLAVNLGAALLQLVPGRVSTEVDIRLSYEDPQRSVDRALRIIDMYRQMGVSKDRVLIKLAGTWQGIRAAHVLESQHGIRTNITLVFAFLQAAAAAQAGACLISPFPGRVLDWHRLRSGRARYHPSADPGVLLTKRMYGYFRKHGYDTICMPASWRPSRGPDAEGSSVDEILALAGVDEMTIPEPLLKELKQRPASDVVEQVNAKAEAAVCLDPDFTLTEESWNQYWAVDTCGQDKLKEGIDAFTVETEKLIAILTEQWS